MPYHHDDLSSSSRGLVGSRAALGDGVGGRGGGCGGIDPENDIARNRDFYRSQDVRPPFTYAALIRQVPYAQKSTREALAIGVWSDRHSAGIPRIPRHLATKVCVHTGCLIDTAIEKNTSLITSV